MHPNSCWGARAAEAAGKLDGNDGFWRMHHWLFDRGGGFTREQLRAGLREMEFDIAEFERLMRSDDVLAPIRDDVDEAIGLGIYFTPTVYINGVELRGWNARNGVRRAVEELAATNPPAMTAAADCPAEAAEKLVGDWQQAWRQKLPATPAFRCEGPEDAPVRVVIFGDYEQDGTAETDGVIRAVVAERGDVRYEYRHFPFNKDCNPAVKKATKYPYSCRAARAAEAAGALAGGEGFWKLHAWMLAHQGGLSDESLQAAAVELGLDPAALLAEMEKPGTGEKVIADAKLGRRHRATSVPTVFINGRKVPRWKLNDENLLARMIAVAAEEE